MNRQKEQRKFQYKFQSKRCIQKHSFVCLRRKYLNFKNQDNKNHKQNNLHLGKSSTMTTLRISCESIFNLYDSYIFLFHGSLTIYVIEQYWCYNLIDIQLEMMKKVKITDFQILTTLGIGTFGRVRLIRHKNTSKFYAAKILKKAEILKSKQIDHVQNESQILSSISHPFIVNMQGFTQDSRYLYYILEYIPGGQLLTHLRNTVRLQSYQAALYAAQIVLIFEYLHDKDIIYRDLKPENLLIAEDGYLKLTDFSFAKIVETRTYTLCGTPQYLAPQVILNQGHGKGVDWWTLGILIYQMNAGIDPFTDDDPMIIYQNILKGKVRFPKDMDKDAKSLIKHLLVADVSKRLGMLKNGVEDVKQHRWLAKIDMKQLLAKKVMMIFKPTIQYPGDTSNFNQYPDSDNLSAPLKANQDPFSDW